MKEVYNAGKIEGNIMRHEKRRNTDEITTTLK